MKTIVVGGGLSGLTAATLLARGGQDVHLIEKARHFGGRAISNALGGGIFNLGPHALYRAGQAQRVLRDLGLPLKGGVPPVTGNCAIADGRVLALPGGFVSLLTTGLLSPAEKLVTAKLLMALPGLDPARWMSTSLEDWVTQAATSPRVRQLVQALFRVSTYADAPKLASAGAAIAQLQLALGENVLYLDGGWQTLVDALRELAERAGVQFLHERAATVTRAQGRVTGVGLADGTQLAAEAVILAIDPHAVATLVGTAEVNAWAANAVPTRAACLDLALTSVPLPKARFALGIDLPTYFSIHSGIAQLGADVVLHVAKYLAPGAHGTEAELEQIVDLMQPGWRTLVKERRFLPELVVTNDLPLAARAGVRPGPAVPGVANLFVAGDWVGEGWLTDAAIGSAETAARQLLSGPEARAAA